MTRAVRYVDDAGPPRLGRLENDRIVDAGPAPPCGFVPSRGAWEQIRAASGTRRPLDSTRLLAPVAPGKIVCAGLNYLDHAREAGQPVPEWPLVFAKLPSAVVGPGVAVEVGSESEQANYEAELAVVIGKRLRGASKDASEAMGGYTALNDVSARRAVRRRPMDTGQELRHLRAAWPSDRRGGERGLVGPACAVSAQRRTRTGRAHRAHDLRSGCDRALHCRSHHARARRSDCHGTPAGVGLAKRPPRFLRPGDHLETIVGDAGVLRNPVKPLQASNGHEPR